MITTPGVHQASPYGPWLRTILTRRSATAFRDEGPTSGELEAILAAAVTVPDRGFRQPWQFIVVDGPARRRFAELVHAVVRAAADNDEAEHIRSAVLEAPTLVTVVARVDTEAAAPIWEQVASASCAAYAMSLAAHELGLGSRWRTIPHRNDPSLRAALAMDGDDWFLGWVEIGRLPIGHEVGEPPRVELGEAVRVMTDDGTTVSYGISRQPSRRRRHHGNRISELFENPQ